MLDKISTIIFGVRFDKAFRVKDNAGAIIDDILYSQKSPFDTELFPQVIEASSGEKVLNNKSTGEYLSINESDIILRLRVRDIESQYAFLKDKVIPYFENELFRSFKIKNIRRLGIIYGHEFINPQQNLNGAVKQLTSSKLESAENISVKFSKKMPAVEALALSGVEDYSNVIYTLEDSGGNLIAEIDYQYYFNPPREDLRECKAELFITNSRSFIEQSFYRWLKSYAIATADARR